ncbi:hypothetical protein EHS25_009316 [Saitozyma podzolica]|uniref:Uncharacterized protein n=1 Tax=Saitozyma podzolica TaxID=1890683 RepID=A0A427YLJ9_9TREE|nr:hypothetical protein EHS25_009316 [Saitozyma podzolica]
MVNASSAGKNIWVAASDGDIDCVRALIEEGMSPNAKDANSYTPVHAAASYHHFPLLSYLISVGGDINLPDSDGDTPLFTVESVDAARWMVEHGADPAWRNDEGLTPADAIEDDHPEISTFLRVQDGAGPSALDVDAFTSTQTSSLLEESRRIMLQSQADGVDPEERLREVVERAVREGLSYGQMGSRGPEGEDAQADGDEKKRTRMDE